MASCSLPAKTSVDEPCARARAFMKAFRAYRETDDDTSGSVDEAEYQLAMYGFEGARSMILGAQITDVHDGAAKALVAYDGIRCFLDSQDTKIDRYDREHLENVSEALRTIWRYFDLAGGSSVRPFAEYVDAVDDVDRRNWGDRPDRA